MRAAVLEQDGISAKYEQGIPVQYLERCFGYTKNEKGEFVPDTEQAKWIVKIYEMAAEGYSLSTIADEMNAAGVKTDKGAGWVESTVKRILENEIYKRRLYHAQKLCE